MTDETEKVLLGAIGCVLFVIFLMLLTLSVAAGDWSNVAP